MLLLAGDLVLPDELSTVHPMHGKFILLQLLLIIPPEEEEILHHSNPKLITLCLLDIHIAIDDQRLQHSLLLRLSAPIFDGETEEVEISGDSLADYVVYLCDFVDVEYSYVSEDSEGGLCLVEEDGFIHAFPKGSLVFVGIEERDYY